MAFRGNSIELNIRANGSLLTARRGLDEQLISVGETVDVFLYRVFVTKDDTVYSLDNRSLVEESIVI